MRNKKNYIWIQKNCRIHDNPALFLQGPDAELVYIAIIDPRFSLRAPVHFQFYLESIKELERNLKQPIKIFYKSVHEVVSILGLDESEDLLVSHAQYTDWEMQIEKNLKEKLGKRFVIIESETLVNDRHQSIPMHYTEFRKKAEETLEVRVLDVPAETSTALDHLENYIWKKKLPLTYKETRNGLMGEDFSTKFSKYLSTGALSAKYIFNEVKRFEKIYGENESTYWIIFELLWRDFFKLQARKQKAGFFKKQGYNNGHRNISAHDEALFAEWCSGKTSNDFINAFMNQLNRTGYMSNRGRQIVASYLIHDLNCDWRAGAGYFESKLIDYDPALNWGNWAYIAGVGSDPRPSRKFNTAKQQLEYDPGNEFINYWLS